MQERFDSSLEAGACAFTDFFIGSGCLMASEPGVNVASDVQDKLDLFIESLFRRD